MAANDAKANSLSTESFKAKLDKEADGANNGTQGSGAVGAVIEKITEFVPAAGQILGNQNSPRDEPVDKSNISGPPDRPDHDDKIEEFVRDQHRSNVQA